MNRHPPPKQKEKPPEVLRPPGRLIADENNNGVTLPDRAKPELRPPFFSLSQRTQYDNLSAFLFGDSVVRVRVIELSVNDYTSVRFPGQKPSPICATLEVTRVASN